MELWLLEQLKQYIHIPAVALGVNIVIDLLKPLISRLPIQNKYIYRTSAFVLCFPVMVLFNDVEVLATVSMDGLVAAILSIAFYDASIYPYLRDKLKEKVTNASIPQ